MPPLINSEAGGACGDEPGMSWHHCSGLNSDRVQKSFRGCCSKNPCDLGRCLYIIDVGDSPDILVRSLKDSRELNTATIPTILPVAESSHNTSLPTINPTPETTVDSDRSENLLQWPLIALITIAAITFLFCIFTTLYGKRRKKEDVETPFLKEDFAKEQHSPSSSLLNQQIGYNEYHQESHEPLPQYVSVKDAPIPDLEKTEVVEPPINSHPAFKNTDQSSPDRPEGEITSQEKFSSLSSTSSSHQLSSSRLEPSDYLLGTGSIDLSQVIRIDSSSPQERRSSNSVSRSQRNHSPDQREKVTNFSSTISATGDLGHRNISEHHKVGSVREKFTSMGRNNSSDTTSTWVEVFPRTKPVKSILRVPNKWGKSAKTKFMSKKPNHIRLSTDRWSGSTLTSNLSTNAAPDWCISGDWGKSTQYDNVLGYLSGTMNHEKNENQKAQHGFSENSSDLNIPANLSNHFGLPFHPSNLSDCCSISSTKSCEISEEQIFKYDTQFYKTGREANESAGAITWGSWMER